MKAEELLEKYFNRKIPNEIDIELYVTTRKIIGLVDFAIKQSRMDALEEAAKVTDRWELDPKISEAIRKLKESES